MKQESALALAVSLTALLAPTLVLDVKRVDGDDYEVTINHEKENPDA